MTRSRFYSTKEKGESVVTVLSSLSLSKNTISKFSGNVKGHVSLTVCGFPVPKVSKLIPGTVSPYIPDGGSHWVRLHRAIIPLVDNHKDCLAGDLLKKVRHGKSRKLNRETSTSLCRLSLIKGVVIQDTTGKGVSYD